MRGLDEDHVTPEELAGAFNAMKDVMEENTRMIGIIARRVDELEGRIRRLEP